MLISFASKRDPAENKVTAVRRWFGACAVARYLRTRTLKDKEQGSHTILHVALASSLHHEIDFAGDDWKQLFMSKKLRIGFIMPDDTLIECRPLWAVKRAHEIELLCLDMAKGDASKATTKPHTMILADDQNIIRRIPVVGL